MNVSRIYWMGLYAVEVNPRGAGPPPPLPPTTPPTKQNRRQFMGWKQVIYEYKSTSFTYTSSCINVSRVYWMRL